MNKPLPPTWVECEPHPGCQVVNGLTHSEWEELATAIYNATDSTAQ
jgi:hypothetical protein